MVQGTGQEKVPKFGEADPKWALSSPSNRIYRVSKWRGNCTWNDELKV